MAEELGSAVDLVIVNLTKDNTFDPPLRAISFGVDGDLKIDTPEDKDVVIPAGFLAPKFAHPIKVEKIHSTANGTTAQKVIGWK